MNNHKSLGYAVVRLNDGRSLATVAALYDSIDDAARVACLPDSVIPVVGGEDAATPKAGDVLDVVKHPGGFGLAAQVPAPLDIDQAEARLAALRDLKRLLGELEDAGEDPRLSGVQRAGAWRWIPATAYSDVDGWIRGTEAEVRRLRDAAEAELEEEAAS